MIKSEKFINRDGTITYYLYDGKDNFLEYTVGKDVEKAGILDAYTNNYTEDAVYDPVKIRKDVMKALGQVDEDFHKQYRLDYPWGGYRANAGRKKGSRNKRKRDGRTERMKHMLSVEEKSFLIEALKYYRKEIEPNLKYKHAVDIKVLECQKLDR